jgi:glycosyltransferase involved in cell wall biosynthesis
VSRDPSGAGRAAPLFSVIIPTFNRAKLVRRAIDSVLDQTIDDFELIVVDDGSVDDTREAIARLTDPRIRFIALATNRGPAAARNAGIQAARGELIALLDSDDEYAPEFLERTRTVLTRADSSVGICWTGTLEVDESHAEGLHRESERRRIWSPKFPSRFHAWRYCLTHDAPWGTNNGVTFKAFVFARSGPFDEAMLACEDMDILIRMMRDFDFVVIPECLVVVHNDALQRVDANKGNQADAWARMYRKYREDIKGDPEAVRFFLKIIASHFRQSGQRGKALIWALRLLSARPSSLSDYKLVLRYLTRPERAQTRTP